MRPLFVRCVFTLCFVEIVDGYPLHYKIWFILSPSSKENANLKKDNVFKKIDVFLTMILQDFEKNLRYYRYKVYAKNIYLRPFYIFWDKS